MGPESPQNPKPDDLPEDERTGHEPDPSRPEACFPAHKTVLKL